MALTGKFLFIIVLYFFTQGALTPILGQAVLHEEEAVLLALQNNFSLRIAENLKQVAHNNVYVGNANNPYSTSTSTGLLPQISFTGNYTKTIQQNRQQTDQTNGGIVPRTNVGLANFGTGLNSTWTLFNGLSGIYFYRQLKEFSSVSDANAQAALDSVLSLVLTAYYDIVQQKQVLNVRKNAVSISEDRLRIAEEREKVGAGSRLEYLQALVDMNTDRSALLRQEAVLHNSKTTLNNLLSRALEANFEVIDVIPIDSTLMLNPLNSELLQNNQPIQAIGYRLNAVKYNQRLLRANRYPTVNLFLNYTYFQSLADPFAQGFNTTSLYTQTVGPNFGFSFSWNLFNGITLKRSIRNSVIQYNTLELQRSNLVLRLQADVRRNFENYSNALELVKLEEQNLLVAQKNADVALDRFKIGSSNSIELRTAQSTFIEAQARKVTAQFTAKQAEIELKRLSGFYSKNKK